MRLFTDLFSFHLFCKINFGAKPADKQREDEVVDLSCFELQILIFFPLKFTVILLFQQTQTRP